MFCECFTAGHFQRENVGCWPMKPTRAKLQLYSPSISCSSLVLASCCSQIVQNGPFFCHVKRQMVAGAPHSGKPALQLPGNRTPSRKALPFQVDSSPLPISPFLLSIHRERSSRELSPLLMPYVCSAKLPLT